MFNQAVLIQLKTFSHSFSSTEQIRDFFLRGRLLFVDDFLERDGEAPEFVRDWENGLGW